MSDMIKNLGNIKEQMGQLKATVEKITASAETGGGMIKATANGEGKIISLKIDVQIINDTDRELAEGLVVSAVNLAIENARKKAEQEMKSLVNIPGLDKLFG